MANFVSAKKAQLVVAVCVLFFVCVSWLSLSSIRQLQGNARVINYTGFLRGATQRLIKKELMAFHDEALLQRLDSIVTELITGHGPNGLIVLQDQTYLENMARVQISWAELKTEIANVRNGKASQRLFELSEDYFCLVDNTVSSAELYSERQVSRSLGILSGLNILFFVCLVGGVSYYLRTLSLEKKAKLLDKLAHFDTLTKLPNRTSCENVLAGLEQNRPEHDVATLVFDMNNLKRVNEKFGHSRGDRLIRDFAEIIQSTAEGMGFVGRYGGDEFIGIFRDADRTLVERYLSQVNEKVVAHNIHRINEIEKISFAVGYAIGNMKEATVEHLIDEADRRMYAQKREMKENRNSWHG